MFVRSLCGSLPEPSVRAYFDHNATSPLSERVLEAMLPFLREHHGNPSSVHRWGREARAALDTAREQVAALVRAHPTQIVFTSGGTEANNLAIKGVCARLPAGHIAVSAVEHPSVSAPARSLTRHGWKVDAIVADADGCVHADAVRRVLRHATRLVSVMTANNETGVIQDIAAIAAAVREHGALLHTDAVQAAGKIGLDFGKSGAHLMTLSAHKIHGPKGAGALVMDKRIDCEPLLHGGSQERGLRAGTENLAAIVGFGAAAEAAAADVEGYGAALRPLRERLETQLAAIPALVIFARDALRLPNTVYWAVPGIDGETLLMLLDGAGFAVSSGSACDSGSTEPSDVLTAMGVEVSLARGAIRCSLGRGNTSAEVDAFVAAVRTQLGALTRLSGRAWA